MPAKNFMNFLAPNAAQATGLSGADQQGQQAIGRMKDRSRACADDPGYCSPLDNWDEYQKDCRAIEKIAKRGRQGGERFSPTDAF